MIQAFNMQHTLQQLHAMPAWLLSWDFERLFTELNQSDLKAKLCWLLEQLFALQTQNLVRVAKGCPAKWSTGDMPANRSERENGASFQYFDLQSAKDAICYLVDHAYFQVGGAVFHQVKGIPMGINPAVYFANYYLFVYEYLFLRDAIQVYNSGNRVVRRDVLNVLWAFKFTKRFVDDLSVLTKTEPRFLDNYLFNDQVDANGVHGIYPRPLVLHSTTVESGRILRSLDVEVFPENSVTGPLFTRLYDKRRQPCFAQAMTLMCFPAIDSKLSMTCKLTVFDLILKL